MPHPVNKQQAEKNKKEAPALYNLAKKAPAPKCPGYGEYEGKCTFSQDGNNNKKLCYRCHQLAK